MTRFLGSLALTLLVFPRLSFGCTCLFPTVAEAVEHADLVFRGRIAKVEYVDSTRTRLRRFLATLEVTAVWKGPIGPTIVVHARQPSSDCIGFWTDVEKEVLVFAKRSVVTRNAYWADKIPVGGRIISPDVCSLSEEIRHTAATLKALGPPRLPVRADERR